MTARIHRRKKDEANFNDPAMVEKNKWEVVLVFPNREDEIAPKNSYVDNLVNIVQAQGGDISGVFEGEFSGLNPHIALSTDQLTLNIDGGESSSKGKVGVTRGQLRKKIVASLEAVGLYVLTKVSDDKKNLFVLITASPELIEDHAEEMELELRLKDEYGGGYTRFTVAKRELFRGQTDLGSTPIGIKEIPHKYFTPLEIPHPPTESLGVFNKTRRQEIITDLIESETDEGGADINLAQLENDKIILKSFCTHSEKAKRTLIDIWVKRPFNHQLPIQPVRHYFGEELGFYFQFLDHYTKFLVPAAFIGIILFAVATAKSHEDNGWSNTVYSAYIILWATFYMEFWKRTRSTSAWYWNMWKYQEVEEIRPGFKGIEKLGAYVGDEWVPLQEGEQYGPLVPHKIPYFPAELTSQRRSTGFIFIGFLCLVVVAATINLLAFRVFMKSTIGNETGPITLYPSIVGGILNALLIMVLNKFYTSVAIKLTNWENHRTISAYNNNLLVKLFLFRFVNSYTSLYYIAFFKHNRRIWGSDKLNDACSDNQGPTLGGGCSEDLTIQLGTLLGTNVVLGLVTEVLLPYVLTKVGDWKKKLPCFKSENQPSNNNDVVEGGLITDAKEKKKSKLPKYERDAVLNTYPGTLDEYSEMVIQYGYITLFAASFPLAPLIALFNNVIEARADALKFLTAYNKPFYHGSEGIGGWQLVMEVMGVLSVVTNCLLIGYSYNGIFSLFTDASQASYYTLVTIVVIEHLLLFLKFIIAVLIPDIPPSVRKLIARQTYIQSQLVKKYESKENKGTGRKRGNTHKDRENREIREIAEIRE